MVATEVEIDQLATDLLGTPDAEQRVKDSLCAATETRQWDEVIKWNRVRWRMRMMARRERRPATTLTPLSAAP